MLHFFFQQCPYFVFDMASKIFPGAAVDGPTENISSVAHPNYVPIFVYHFREKQDVNRTSNFKYPIGDSISRILYLYLFRPSLEYLSLQRFVFHFPCYRITFSCVVKLQAKAITSAAYSYIILFKFSDALCFKNSSICHL